MNKSQLIETVAQRCGVDEKHARGIIDTMFDEIISVLDSGDKVTLSGFGTFVIKSRIGRNYINPKTKNKDQIPDRNIPAFRPSVSFRCRLNAWSGKTGGKANDIQG